MATPVPMCVAPQGWFCSPVGTVVQCPGDWYCSGGILPPRQCPDGKRAAEGSVYLTDCSDSGNVVFSVILVLMIVSFFLVFCCYCLLDWFQFQGIKVVHFPSAREVQCPPPRCRPEPSAPDFVPEPSAPKFVYYHESGRAEVYGQAAMYQPRPPFMCN